MRAGIAVGLALAFGMSASGQEVNLKGQAPAETKSPNGAKALTGHWVAQSCIAKGQEQLPNKAAREMIRLSIANGEYKLFYITDPDPEKMMGRRLATADLAVDEKAGTFELTIKDGGKKGDKRHGIYELTKTGLKMCYGPADKPRPTKFEAPADSDNFCETWELYKK
jgi:uncharacterized protein (TIGR03067 family)